MRIRFKLFLIIFFFNIIGVNSQKKDIEIKKDSLKYNVLGKNFNYKRIKIKNNSKEEIIFWITQDRESIQDYFGVKGDFSLKELLTEDSIENFSSYPVLFLNFIKIIRPYEDFYLLHSCNKEPFLNIYKYKELPIDVLSAIDYARKNYEERFYQPNMIFLPDVKAYSQYGK